MISVDLELLSHLDQLETLFGNRAVFPLLTLSGHVRTQQCDEEKNTQIQMNDINSILTLEWLPCSENITDTETETNSLDMCCLGNRSQKDNVDNMVLHLRKGVEALC